MHERLLPASPNWYCSRSSDINSKGVFGFAAKNTIYLISVSESSTAVVGELAGHRERVSGFTFCHHPGQENVCASASDDGTVKIWDIEQKVSLKDHKAHQSTITALHWSPVQKDLVVSGDEKGIIICYWHNRNETLSFFPEPRNIFCLSCSPHNENHIAVGYKDGMIIVMDISRKNEVVHRLRGHDDEVHGLSWSPQPGEELLYSRLGESPEASSEVSAGGERGCYLASGSKDQTVRIWSTTRGKGVMTLKLPSLKRRGVGVDPGVKERLWLTVHWPKGRPTHVVSSCFGGELVIWDLVKSGKQKWSLLGGAADIQAHSRIVFNMSSVCLGGHQLLLSTSMDREIKCWDLETLECCWTLPTLGGFVYTLTFSPVGTGCLAMGVGDSMIRVWNTLSVTNKYDTKTFWQGVKSKVTALSWHPTKEGSLAFGTDDGKVGIYDVFSNKPPQISSTYHRKTVYSLAWGPPVPLLPGPDEPPFSLYSCAGEGVIFQHNPWGLADEAVDIDGIIRRTNNIKHKLSPHTDLNWKPDGKALAIGNEDGSVDVYQAPSLRLLCSVQQHHKIINVLRWHHEHGGQSGMAHLLASGSSNAVVYVHDLRAVIESPPESPVLITEAFRSLAGHTAKITGLAWSPHHSGRLVTVCYDGTAQVWDVLGEEPVCNYRGHHGRLLCVQWSPVDPDVVWTGGDDFTVQEWTVSKQEHTRPPRGKKSMDLEKKRTLQPKSKSKKKKPADKGAAKMEEAETPNGQEQRGGGEGPSDNDDAEREALDKLALLAVKEPTGLADRGIPEKLQNGVKPPPFTKKESRDDKRRERPETLLKKRKGRSILPLSTSMDHRPKEELQEDCLTLAAVRHSEAVPSQCLPGSGEHLHLGLFGDRQALYRMFQEEGQSHVEGGHYDSAIYLLLWKGDIAGALQLATDRGELTDHLVSMAPMAGYQVWSRTVEAFVKQLSFQEQFVKAASYLLSINRIYEAVNLLKSHSLYREAIALAKARLQPEDHVLKDLYTTWAAVLEKDGHYSTAAKCYLAADCPFEAAKVIAKKGDVASMKTAAELARIVGEKELAHSLALRCAKELLAAQDWLGAQEVLRSQDSLLGHQLLFCTNELLVVRLAGTNGMGPSCSPTHSWSVPHAQSFLENVKDVWEREFGVSPDDAEKIRAVRSQLKALENPSVASSVAMKQLLFHMSLDMTHCVLSWLLGDWGAGLEELLRAVARSREAESFCLMSDVCQLFFPQGIESISQYKAKLDPSDEQGAVVTRGLEAFLSYVQLYAVWWATSGSTATSAGALLENWLEGGPDVEPGQEVGPSLGFCQTLLSEPHASLQATQRAIAEVQRRLSSMVQQHAQIQKSQATAGDSEGGEAAEQSSDSLPALIARVSEHHKELAALPDHLKNIPFPEVVECCLVLLYMARTLHSVPPQLTDQALQLLRRHGHAFYPKASQNALADRQHCSALMTQTSNV
ncbi:gem-associated protein 5 isoform X1 [Brienomyrus brachyistius]|uniref:gem-associated protein 5 isoform X1 n=1 Tax=Brienomyrus brachyistius TaxID=42636 RepID=UPI0020B2C849|nr:gem-associated protein 5 isoform X1 [Brienomyrus brachyistius]